MFVWFSRARPHGSASVGIGAHRVVDEPVGKFARSSNKLLHFTHRRETGKSGRAKRRAGAIPLLCSGLRAKAESIGLGSRESDKRLHMCVYLAPRWRRRSSPLLVMIVLALATLTVQGRTMTGSGSGAVQQQEVGVVTTDTTQSTTTVNKAWNSTDSSQPCEQKSVSFDSLVKTTTAPIEQSTEQPKSFSSSASASMDHEILTPKSTGSSSDSSCEGKRHHASDDSTKQDDDDGSFDDNEKDESDDSHAGKMNHTTIFKPNEKAINKISTVNKTATLPQVTPAPTPKTPGPTLPTTAASVHVLPPNPGTFEAKPTDWTSNSGSDKSKSWSNSGSNDQSVEGQSYEDTNSAKALENKTKSASLATSSRALDQTLVVVIVGVVGAIGALLMFVSRKVLKETGDDKDLEDTSIF